MLAGIVATTTCSLPTLAQMPQNPRSVLPANFQTIKQGEFNRLQETEGDFSDFYDVEVTRFYHDDAIRLNPSLGFNPGAVKANPCANGDFESGLDTNEWKGGFGFVSNTGQVLYGGFGDGIFGGPINLGTSRQTLVAQGPDPFVPISTTSSAGSTRAVRVGNAVPGMGAEFLSKTLTVTASRNLFTFKYALVLQSPNHNPIAKRPGFRVRVIDSTTGVELPNVVNLGNGSNVAIADPTANLFFKTNANGTIVYRDWDCAQINLSAHIGKKVTIQFVTNDCALTPGHWGYAYIDDFCGSCANANYDLALDKADCDRSTICFKYRLPFISNLTGTLNITLRLYQSGVLKATQASGVLTGDSQYCFTLSPATLAALDPALGGFDYAAEGTFMHNGQTLAPRFVFTAPNGAIAGQNNDCELLQAPQCCPGTNLLINGGFEQGNVGFTSDYTYQGTVAPASVLPGRYSVLTDAQAGTVSPTWQPNCPTYNRHLVVNGLTGGTAARVIWRQTVTTVPGRTYKFCGDFKSLTQCGFDVTPSIGIKISQLAGGHPPLTSPVTATTGTCNWTNLQQTITATGTTYTIAVYLNETGQGDGNDIAVDNLSFIELQAVTGTPLNFTMTPFNTNATSYSMSATAQTALPADCKHYWEVEELDSDYQIINSTQVINPVAWQPLTTNTFNGYVGTNTLSGTAPAVFDNNKIYRFGYGRSCSCAGLGKRYYIYTSRGLPKSAGSGNQSGPYLLETGIYDADNHAVPTEVYRTKTSAAIKVYPNPTSDKITVQRTLAGETLQVKVFNAYGQLVRSATLEKSEAMTEVSLAAFAPGNYMLQVAAANGGILHTEKITKQ